VHRYPGQSHSRRLDRAERNRWPLRFFGRRRSRNRPCRDQSAWTSCAFGTPLLIEPGATWLEQTVFPGCVGAMRGRPCSTTGWMCRGLLSVIIRPWLDPPRFSHRRSASSVQPTFPPDLTKRRIAKRESPNTEGRGLDFRREKAKEEGSPEAGRCFARPGGFSLVRGDLIRGIDAMAVPRAGPSRTTLVAGVGGGRAPPRALISRATASRCAKLKLGCQEIRQPDWLVISDTG